MLLAANGGSMRLLRVVVEAAKALQRAHPMVTGEPALSRLHVSLLAPERSVVRGAKLDGVRCPLLVVDDHHVVVVAVAYAGTREVLHAQVAEYVHAGADGVLVLSSRRRLLVGAPGEVEGMPVRYLLMRPSVWAPLPGDA